MGDYVWQAHHLSISPSHRGQLHLLPSGELEMSAIQSVVISCYGYMYNDLYTFYAVVLYGCIISDLNKHILILVTDTAYLMCVFCAGS